MASLNSGRSSTNETHVGSRAELRTATACRAWRLLLPTIAWQAGHAKYVQRDPVQTAPLNAGISAPRTATEIAEVRLDVTDEILARYRPESLRSAMTKWSSEPRCIPPV